MSVILYAESSNGLLPAVSQGWRVGELELQLNAAEASVGTSKIVIDDPDGTFYMRGLKPLYVVETEATGDAYLGIIGVFWSGNRVFRRGPYRNGAGREVVITANDLNTLLSYRVQKGTDAERSAETDVQRMTWLIGTAEVIGGHGDHGFTIEDTTYFDHVGPVNMGETDYTGTDAAGVINDALQDSGKNAYLLNKPTSVTSPIRVGIWYAHSSSSNFSSQHKISNDLDDVSEDTLDYFATHSASYSSNYVFAPSLDAELDRDPSRQITGAMVKYDSDYVYASNPIIEPTLTRRDMSFAAELVKTQAQATQRANRYLEDLEEEDDAITCAVIVPGKLVNGFHQGMRVQVKFTHLPGYESDYVWMRIASRTVRQIPEGAGIGNAYEIAMDLRAEAPPGPPIPEPPGPFTCTGGDYDATASAIYPRLGQEDGNAAGVHYYWNAGDDRPDVPTPFWTGGSWSFPVYDGSGDFNVSNLNFWSMIFVGPGTLTVHTVADSRGGGHTTATMWRASVSHFVGAVPVEDFTQDGVPGVDEVIEIPEDAGDDCIHVVTISCPEHDGPGGMGANGCTWVLG